MQVKCSSCGASQGIINTQNCNFCGSIINKENIDVGKSEIIYSNKDLTITLFNKALEIISTELDLRILLKNISNVSAQLKNQSKYVHLFFMSLATIFFLGSFYSSLIPHKEYIVDKYGYTYEVMTEVSIGTFIFSLFFISPIIWASYFLKKRYDNFKSKTKNNTHSIKVFIKGLEDPKNILIGSINDTNSVFFKIKEITEKNKMSD